jgi:hypothetical protein
MNLHLHLKHAKAALRIALACGLGLALAPLHAAPITPTRDDEVIEVLPAMAGGRSEQRRLRQQLARQPRDAALALTLAQRYLDQAHELGDPRFAGMALSAIGAWTDDATMPDGILMMRATLQQYLHEFDASVQSLQHLLARPGAPRPQVWLTLATVRRVQGRYADSDMACHQVALTGAMVHANACLAENKALRGDVSPARNILQTLIASGTDLAQTRAWLKTSLAELEQRAGHAVAADAAYRASLALDPDSYTTLAYADFLIEQRRPAQALALLKDQVRSDAVLLRLAIAGALAHATSASADAAEMRERIALANERPDAKIFHAREQAMFALTVDHDVPRALELARGNVARQREPLDLLVLAQTARASGEPAALEEARRLTREMGLVDRRINAIL